jgi:hypothetical protein
VAHGDAAPRVLPATWRSYPPRGPSGESSLIRAPIQFSNPIFKATLGGLLVLKMDHAGSWSRITVAWHCSRKGIFGKMGFILFKVLIRFIV